MTRPALRGLGVNLGGGDTFRDFGSMFRRMRPKYDEDATSKQIGYLNRSLNHKGRS